jgi:predicted nucleic acid-binding protein
MLFDTTILIDYLRGHEAARRLVELIGAKPHVSAASVLELYAGLRGRRDEQQTEQFLSQTVLLPVTVDIAKRAGVFVRHYHASDGVAPMDALIAATAEHHGLRLATLNVKHFPMFPKLKPAY